ncbi:MAG: T3SS effector HopA1 family protein [Acidobacteriota bacterium]|nr:T3SS effector HopA1 family protein [Acidobacteriota bacterium]
MAGRGRVEVEKYGVVFTLEAGSVRPAAPATGAPCRVRVPAETAGLLPGFWSVVGEADPWEPADTPWLLRLYWNLLAPAAPLLVHRLTSGLNASRIPFRLKVIGDPLHYRRADAGVLYLDPRGWDAARPVVERAHSAVAGELRPEVPRLAARLAPGLAFSEGPANGASFGSHRCGLIARALVEAFAAGASTAAARRDAVAGAFQAAGLDPRRPHLAPGSPTDYRPLAPDGARRAAAASLEGLGPSAVTGSDSLLVGPGGALAPEDIAAEIGDALCASAYRHEGRCNWMGGLPSPDSAGSLDVLAALGADLYGGTAGIAVFLAELYEATGDGEHRDTAVAAQRQALAAVRAEPERCVPLAFYEGQLGVACAARRVATLTANEALAAAADGLLRSLVPTLPGPRRSDVISGSAGAILALIRLHEETGDASFLEAAAQLGQELARDAVAGANRGRPPLTGFGHGAAGIGLALLELGVKTGTAGLRAAADRLFGYEDGCFDPASGNWLARGGPPATGSARAPGLMVAWCHGATGIALSRLRALAVDPARRARYEAAARAGLAATAARIGRELDRPGADLGLCHGLGGMTEVVSLGAEILDEPGLRASAREARERLPALARAATRFADPCLFTGAAGIGYAMLRLGRPGRIPSMLLPAAAVPAARERARSAASRPRPEPTKGDVACRS